MVPLEIGFHGVFVSQLWAAMVSLAKLELSIHWRLGIGNSSMRITCPTHRSWALMSMDSMLVELARSRTSRLVMRSCQLIPSMERRARMWKDSSYLTYLRYSVHNRRGGRGELQHCILSVSLIAGSCVG